MAWKCLIVDDEPPAIGVMKKYIEATPMLLLSGACKNAFEALDFLSRESIDLIFLDIHMPRLIGTEMLRSLPHPPRVIFTSAHKDFAIEAFELDAVDYLLKPISYERFLRAVNKVLHLPVSNVEISPPAPGFVYFRSDRKMMKVFLEEILYLESYKDYVTLHLINGRELKVKLTLNHVEKMLPASQFVRIHRSYMVSVAKITAFTKTDVEIGRKELPIGRSFAAVFRKLAPDAAIFPDGVEERGSGR